MKRLCGPGFTVYNSVYKKGEAEVPLQHCSRITLEVMNISVENIGTLEFERQ